MKRIIVESKNDKFFFEGLLSHLRPENTIVVSEMVDSLEFPGENGKEIRGLSPIAIEKALKRINFKSDNIQVGILIDADIEGTGSEGMLGGIQNRIQSVNCIVERVWGVNPNFEKVSLSVDDFKTITVTTDTYEEIEVKIGCYFVNVNGQGELETVLRKITKNFVPHAADCLEAWRDCYLQKVKSGVIEQGYEIKTVDSFDDKELGKLWQEFYKCYDVFLEKELDAWWAQFYHKFDTVKHNKRGKSDENTSYEMIFLGKKNGELKGTPRHKEMYDFDSPLPEFQELCSFLKCFL